MTRWKIVQCNIDGVHMNNLFDKIFGKGSSIDDIFKKAEDSIKKMGDSAEKKLMEYYNNAPEVGEAKSARHIFMDILQDGPMEECGCCYKVPGQAFDLAAIELASQMNTILEVKALCEKGESVSSKDILEIIYKEHRTAYAMSQGVRGLIKAGKGMYLTTMMGYARNYRRDNPHKERGAFDNILGMHVVVNDVIKKHTKKEEPKGEA